MTASATLSAHAGGYTCTEDAVRAVVIPNGTKTWCPIGHNVLIDLIGAELDKRGLIVEERQYAMVDAGAQMFGTYTLRADRNKDFTLALGIRNSINKTLPAGMCAGSRVFVCDNLAFSAAVTLGRKHTMNIMEDLPLRISETLEKFKSSYEDQENLFNHWKGTAVGMDRASNVIMSMAEAGHIPTPMTLRVRQEFRAPRFAEFNGQTAWSLYNAATTLLRHDRKEINPIRHSEDLLGIHQMMAAEFSLN